MATLLPDDKITREDLHGYRVFIWSHDHPIPPHVHLGRMNRVSSWNLQTQTCEDEDGFSPSELRQQRTILQRFADQIWERWHDHWQRQNRR